MSAVRGCGLRRVLYFPMAKHLRIVACWMIAALLLPTQNSDAAPLERMSPQLLARTASSQSVYANVCSKWFPVDVKGTQETQDVVMQLGRLNSASTEAFDELLKQEVARRYEEVDKIGEWEWCTAKRRDYEKPDVKHVAITPEQFAWANAGLAISLRYCRWRNAVDTLNFIRRKYAEDLSEYDTGGRYVHLVDRAYDNMLQYLRTYGARAGCAELARQMHPYISDYPGPGWDASPKE